MNKTDGLQALEKPLASLPDTLRQLILERIQNLTHYEPVIGIMGKSGAGKSSLCNELFRGKVSAVSDVNACTRDILRFRLRSGRHSLVIVDLPGVGENGQGCYFAVVDDRMANYWTAVEDKLLYQYPAVENVDEKAAELKKQFTPEVMMMVKDNCVNKRQQAALAARRTEKDRELQQWVAQQSLAELCRRTGNC